jgi:hypothetical protein
MPAGLVPSLPSPGPADLPGNPSPWTRRRASDHPGSLGTCRLAADGRAIPANRRKVLGQRAQPRTISSGQPLLPFNGTGSASFTEDSCVGSQDPSMTTMQDTALARAQREPIGAWELQRPADWPQDDLSAARGIARGVALGAAMWGGVGLLLWFLL